MPRTRKAGSSSRSTRKKRKLRSRPAPKMLTAKNDHDDVAKRRVLMILSVLSGEKAVTEVIAEHRISRPTYYQQETKALTAMLEALTPGQNGSRKLSKVDELTRQVEKLQAKLEASERRERRTQRLLHMTRKMVKPGKVTTGKKRKSRRRSSKTTGSKSSTTCEKRQTSKTKPGPSTRMRASAVES
jgi:hypothetical protein